jgi:hypothetical protein
VVGGSWSLGARFETVPIHFLDGDVLKGVSKVEGYYSLGADPQRKYVKEKKKTELWIQQAFCGNTLLLQLLLSRDGIPSLLR